MRRLAPARMLVLWERLSGRDPCTQAVVLAAAAGGLDDAGAAALPVGERDRRLYRFHARLFGPGIECVADCPGCGEVAEASFDSSALALAPQQAEPVVVECDEGYRILCRLPTSADLAQALHCGDARQAAARLLGGLIEATSPRGEALPADGLPATVRERVTEALAQAQPAADVELALECAACGRHWTASFDIGSYLAQALGREARQLMDTVDLLAARYGWSEADILALPAQRRRYYVERALA